MDTLERFFILELKNPGDHVEKDPSSDYRRALEIAGNSVELVNGSSNVSLS